jgi:spore coat polysaccharide biosynthesis protein SpsF
MPVSISKANAMGRVVTIIQARMGSERLPGKVLATINGSPILALIIKRISPSRLRGELVVATTEQPEDDVIEDLSCRLGVSCFRGATEDCLDRYYQAAKRFQAQTVVRLTADNPLIDHGFLDWALGEFAAAPGWDYLITSSDSFPLGLSVEIFSFSALETAWEETGNPAWREHVTPYIHRAPERFRIRRLSSPEDYSHMRWTVDTPEDLKFVRAVYDHFGHDRFSWREAIAAVENHPEWVELNRHVEQRLV